MKIKSAIALSILTLALTGCGSEYTPEEINLSSKGTFVKKGSDSEVSGTFVVEKVTGESLRVELNDGLPDGDIEMKDEQGNTILSSSFKRKSKQNVSGFDLQFVNVLFSEAVGEASTRDYLGLFKRLSEFDGDYLEIDRNNQKTEGNYENGEKLGRWRTYCENKQLSSDQTFKEFKVDDKNVIKKVGDDLKFTCDGDIILSAKRDKKSRLQGEYIENQSNLKPRYVRQYKDGELDGPQKEYSYSGNIDRESNYSKGVLNGVQKKYNNDGRVSLENNYKNSVKDGVENVYSTGRNHTTKETVYWLSEIKNYSNGQLNGQYQKLDEKKRVLELGSYQSDKKIGQWIISDYKYNSKKYHDFDANNFTLEKQKAFKEACRLPATKNSSINWSKSRSAPTDDCQYYIENALVDINKKITLDYFLRPPTADTFEKSTGWTYPVIVAKPNIYNLMKQAGVKTGVSDSEGRTRLHYCVSQFRKQSKKYPRCSLDQLKEYAKDANLNGLSNIGTAFHEMALKYGYISRKQQTPILALEKDALNILVDSGANLNQTNHAGKTPLMAALENGNYDFAEYLVDAGASVKGRDINDKSILGHFFISKGGKLKTSALDDNAVRVLAKAIALGMDTKAPILNDKTIKAISEEHNTLFHIRTLQNATAMSANFKEALSNRPQITEPEVAPAPPVTTKEVTPETKQISSIESNSIDDVTNTPQETVSTNEGLETANQDAPQSVDNSAIAELLKQQSDFLVTQANEHIANYRLKTPKSNSALGTLEQLQKIDPNNENINIIKESIGKKYLSLTDGKIKKGQKTSAQNSLNSAKEFLTDGNLISQYQTKINNITETVNKQNYTPSPVSATTLQTTGAPALACDPKVKLAGIPLIGGQSLTAEQPLPMSVSSALRKSLTAVRKTYTNIKQSGKKITYEQSTSTKPIKFTLTVSASGNYSKINIKAKTPTGIVIKKSGYKQGFCELLANF